MTIAVEREYEQEIERLRKALQQIADAYENPNIGHEEFRVKAAHCARGALGAVGSPPENTERK